MALAHAKPRYAALGRRRRTTANSRTHQGCVSTGGSNLTPLFQSPWSRAEMHSIRNTSPRIATDAGIRQVGPPTSTRHRAVQSDLAHSGSGSMTGTGIEHDDHKASVSCCVELLITSCCVAIFQIPSPKQEVQGFRSTFAGRT